VRFERGNCWAAFSRQRSGDDASAGGYQLEGPAEPGVDADVPGVLGGPGITVVSEDEDEPDNRWSEHPR
jgi:hypothetical protein